MNPISMDHRCTHRHLILRLAKVMGLNAELQPPRLKARRYGGLSDAILNRLISWQCGLSQAFDRYLAE